ncbi:hypothetical protein [Dethiosulfovibrio salsuginis]|uniref:Major facilitator superfamily (MFS) profile domain-containing protein n=1 Tax=Dethiosulfovibrio salsuginis TaxID=561720 RepID=A0A1X7J4J0_9BACT|nr:hypothetical protein [Dethiosulfovibrio salsuginis]SMG22464.1 hypothetical protein SAMN06275492_10838 [Dethiosulfovibrio salsuginis]
MSQSRSIYRSLFADPAFTLFIVLAGSFFLTVFFRIWFILLGSTVSGLPVWAGGAAALLLGAVTGVRGVFALAGVTALAPTEERGVVFGAMNMIAVLSAVIFQWGTGIVIDHFPTTQPGVYTTEGYFTAFLLVSSAIALSLLALRSLGRDPLKGE